MQILGQSVVPKPPDQTEEGHHQGFGQTLLLHQRVVGTCNILRLLEQGRLLSGPPAPPNSLLGPPHPVHNGSLLSSPGGGSSTSPGISSSTPPSSLAGGTFGLSLPSLTGTPSSPRLGVPPPHSLCFSMPLLGGAHHELTSAYGCGSSAFEPYMRLDRKEADLGGKKTVS
ncbi:Ventral anterior homeobox 2 [Larimichthys crocea]|uniref:Ventral anterior homeobox 2 n=1 Tax=Larimichthys crocea TaxID=215358 RepID=A0A6G0HJP0_LARCR|nr:Ventral anterior homeobox 2 [Larimichthys crocea]